MNLFSVGSDPREEPAFESKEAIAWFRHAEIKHGRVAMFAFCGYVAQANGAHMPWDGFLGPLTTGATPEEQWFNLSIEARGQIIAFIGVLEFWDELSAFPAASLP